MHNGSSFTLKWQFILALVWRLTEMLVCVNVTYCCWPKPKSWDENLFKTAEITKRESLKSEVWEI